LAALPQTPSAMSTRGMQIARYDHLVTPVSENNGTTIIIIYKLLLTGM
jgi:hypothetical protein